MVISSRWSGPAGVKTLEKTAKSHERIAQSLAKAGSGPFSAIFHSYLTGRSAIRKIFCYYVS